MYVRHITTRSNKFMESAELVGSTWKLRVSLNIPYTVISKCLRVPRPIGTWSGNNPVPGVYKGIASVMVIVVIAVTSYMRSEIEREWREDVGGVFLRFLDFIWAVSKWFDGCEMIEMLNILVFFHNKGETGIGVAVQCYTECNTSSLYRYCVLPSPGLCARY